MSEEIRRREREWQETREATSRASTPVLADLAIAGFRLDSISDLWDKRYDYRSVIPVLMGWLPRVSNYRVKEMIVRALSVQAAKPVAAPLMVSEFQQAPSHEVSGLKWAIGNALSVVADDSVFEELVGLAQDRAHGKAREMVVVGLGNMKDARAGDVLIGLLHDEEVAGHAIIALGKLKAARARTPIEPFLDHPKSWIRNEARRALAKIDKAQQKMNPGTSG